MAVAAPPPGGPCCAGWAFGMTLDLYIARRFLGSFLRVFAVFLGVLTLIDLIVHMRRFSATNISLTEALFMALLNVPQNLYRILPLLMVLAGITLFLGLAKSSELVVVRAAVPGVVARECWCAGGGLAAVGGGASGAAAASSACRCG